MSSAKGPHVSTVRVIKELRNSSVEAALTLARCNDHVNDDGFISDCGLRAVYGSAEADVQHHSHFGIQSCTNILKKSSTMLPIGCAALEQVVNLNKNE